MLLLFFICVCHLFDVICEFISKLYHVNRNSNASSYKFRNATCFYSICEFYENQQHKQIERKKKIRQKRAKKKTLRFIGSAYYFMLYLFLLNHKSKRKNEYKNLFNLSLTFQYYMNNNRYSKLSASEQSEPAMLKPRTKNVYIYIHISITQLAHSCYHVNLLLRYFIFLLLLFSVSYLLFFTSVFLFALFSLPFFLSLFLSFVSFHHVRILATLCASMTKCYFTEL